MKNILFSIATLFLLLSVSACKKDKGNNGGYFRFKVDGANFEATDLLAYAVDFNTYFNMYGVKDASAIESCYVSILPGTVPGTYTFDDEKYYAYYSDASGEAYSSRWGSGSGSVTIQEIDATHVKGKFQCTMYDADTETIKRTFTEGEFDVEFR